MHANGIFSRFSNTAIGLIRDENLVPFAEIETAEDCVRSARGIVHEDQVFAIHTEKLRDVVGSSAQSRLLRRRFPDAGGGEFSQEKARWLLFNFFPEFLLRIENAPRRCADGSVIEICDRGI